MWSVGYEHVDVVACNLTRDYVQLMFHRDLVTGGSNTLVSTTIFSSPKGEGFRPSPEETLSRSRGGGTCKLSRTGEPNWGLLPFFAAAHRWWRTSQTMAFAGLFVKAVAGRWADGCLRQGLRTPGITLRWPRAGFQLPRPIYPPGRHLQPPTHSHRPLRRLLRHQEW